MKKKTRWIALALILVAGLVTGLVIVVYHEPAFYQRATVAAGKERKEMSLQFPIQVLEMADRFKDNRDHYPRKKDDWIYQFKEEEINSFFEEDFVKGGIAELFAQRGISAPRVVIESERIRLGFRYGIGPFSTIISVDFRLWLVPREINTVAVEVMGRRAGALPISAQFFLDQLTEAARKANIEVTWYRHNGNPVALLRFSDRLRPTAQLRRLELHPGMLAVVGVPLENMQHAHLDPR